MIIFKIYYLTSKSYLFGVMKSCESFCFKKSTDVWVNIITLKICKLTSASVFILRKEVNFLSELFYRKKS